MIEGLAEGLLKTGWKTEGPMGNLFVKRFGDFRYTVSFREKHVVLAVSGPNGTAVSAVVPEEEVQQIDAEDSPLLIVTDYKVTLALPTIVAIPLP